MKYLFLIASFFILVSCAKTDNCYEPLAGYYSLSSVSCECKPIVIIPHQQQWLFDFNKSEVDVKTFGEVKSFLVLKEGVYKFEIVKDAIISTYDSTDLIRINGLEFGFLQNTRSINLSSGSPLGIADLPDYSFLEN